MAVAPTPCVLPGAYDMNLGGDSPVLSTSAGWIECVDNNSTASSSFAQRYGNCTLTGWITDDPVPFYYFVNKVLGWTVTLTDGTLKRIPPIRHPRNPQLYATKISSADGKVFGNKIDANGKVVPIVAPEKPFYNTQFNTTALGGMQRWARYGRQLVTIEFQPARMRYLTDAQCIVDGTQKEYRRYIDFDIKPNFYNVTIQTGNFQYAEGPNSGGTAGIGEINYLEVKTTFALRWRGVPEDYVANTIDYIFPFYRKVVGSAGRVNSAAFGGYPAGTLLILEPDIERYVNGTLYSLDLVPPATPGNLPLYYADVMLPIVHFDPPNSSGDPAVSGNRGHNLKPWWAAGTSVVKYYLVTNNGDASTGLRIYGSADYEKIFTHWSLG